MPEFENENLSLETEVTMNCRGRLEVTSEVGASSPAKVFLRCGPTKMIALFNRQKMYIFWCFADRAS